MVGHEPLGDPQAVKHAVDDAAAKAAELVGAAEGVPVLPDTLPTFAGKVASSVLGDVLGLTDQVRGRPQAVEFCYEDLFGLATPGSKAFGSLHYNVETELLTDGDASYKVYFDVKTYEFNPL